MTDDQTLTDDPRVDGRVAWPWIKDAGLLSFALFFGVVVLILRSLGMDDATGASGPGGGATGPIEASLVEFAIEGDFDVSAGQLTIHAVNDGTVDHNLVIPELGYRSAILKPGEEVTIDLGQVATRTYAVFCDLSGHRESGMETELVVSSR